MTPSLLLLAAALTPKIIIIGVLGFIVAFGLAVLVHELGHFLAAKAFKVPVERFVIGFDKHAMPFMPRCIFEKKIGETTYGLSLVPLGGYVKMAGVIHPDIERYLEGEPEESKGAPPGEVAEIDAAGLEVLTHRVDPAEPHPEVREDSLTGQAILDQAALYKKPFWQKVIIYGAGVVMNMLLAMVMIATVLVRGEEVDAPIPAVVGWQAPDSWLTAEGFQQGDRIVSVNGMPVEDSADLLGGFDREGNEVESALRKVTEEARLASPEQPVARFAFEVERNGVRQTVDFDLPLQVDAPTPEARTLYTSLLAYPAHIAYVIQFHPADKAGVREGDTVLAVDGEPIDDYNELVYVIRRGAGMEQQWLLDRKGEEVAAQVTPRSVEDETTEKEFGQVGISPGTIDRVRLSYPVGQALAMAPKGVYYRTVGYAKNLGKLFGRLFQGKIRQFREEIGGPVAIASLAGKHANMGLGDFLNFMIMLNIALAVMNILPFPVLDGGHIVLAAYEAVFGKPVPPKVLVPLLNGAVFVLLGFVVLVTLSDVLKVFG